MLDTVRELRWKHINYLLSNGSKTICTMIDADPKLSDYLLSNNLRIQFEPTTHIIHFHNIISNSLIDIPKFAVMYRNLIPNIILNVEQYAITKSYIDFKRVYNFIKHVSALEHYYYWNLRHFPCTSLERIYEYFYAYPKTLPQFNPLLCPAPVATSVQVFAQAPVCTPSCISDTNTNTNANDKNKINQEFFDKILLIYPHHNPMTKSILYTLKLIATIDLCVDPCNMLGINPSDIDLIRKHRIPTHAFSIKQLICDFIQNLNIRHKIIHGPRIQEHKLWLYKIIYDEPYFFTVQTPDTIFNELNTVEHDKFAKLIILCPDNVIEYAFILKSFEFIKHATIVNNYELNRRILQKIFSYDYLELLEYFMKRNLFACVGKSVFDSDLLYWLCVNFLDKYSFDIAFFIMRTVDYETKILLWEVLIRGKYFDIMTELYEMCSSVDVNTLGYLSNMFGLGMERFMNNFDSFERAIYDEIKCMIGYNYGDMIGYTSSTETNYLNTIRNYEMETKPYMKMSSCSYRQTKTIMNADVFFDYIRAYAPTVDTDTSMYDKKIFYTIFFDNHIGLQNVMGKVYNEGYISMGYVLKKLLCVSARFGSRECFTLLLKKMITMYKSFDNGENIFAEMKKCVVKISVNIDLWFVKEMYEKHVLTIGEMYGVGILLNDHKIFEFANVHKKDYLLDINFCLKIVKHNRLKLFDELFKHEYVYNNYRNIMEELKGKQDMLIYEHVVGIYNSYKNGYV